MNSLGLKNESVLCFLSLFSLTTSLLYVLSAPPFIFGAPRLTHE